MKTKTTYQDAKKSLLEIANQAKEVHKGDKPMICQIINDYADQLIRELPKGKHDLLSNYAASLHP
jgi:hypothetical protein